MLPCYGLIAWVPPERRHWRPEPQHGCAWGQGSKGEVEAEGGRKGTALTSQR